MRLGIFDSGLGGLLTAKYVAQLNPSLSWVYYGDTAHLPYGDKSPTAIKHYVQRVVQFLIQQEVDGIVIACHTASSVVGSLVRQWVAPLPVWDVITPTVQYVQQLKSRRIGVIGTYATLRSRIYHRLLGEGIEGVATPLLVPLIEEGWITHPLMDAVLERYLSAPALQDIQALILGCTHYPLIKSHIEAFYASRKQQVHVIDTAYLVAQQVAQAYPVSSHMGNHVFYVSDLQERFEQLATEFWGAPLDISVDPTYVSNL
ncbi:MAG: glutamate racemase [Bacteroidia bacterium]